MKNCGEMSIEKAKTVLRWPDPYDRPTVLAAIREVTDPYANPNACPKDALLKALRWSLAQMTKRPHVLSRAEALSLKDRTPVWCERRTFGAGWIIAFRATTETECGYGQEVRYWDAEPLEWQRKEVPWDD